MSGGRSPENLKCWCRISVFLEFVAFENLKPLPKMLCGRSAIFKLEFFKVVHYCNRLRVYKVQILSFFSHSFFP